jgi:hypothetical protein
MGPIIAIIAMCAVAIFAGMFFKTVYYDRATRKDLLGLIAELDAKLSRAEQQEMFGERYERIRDRLKRYKNG